MNNKKIKSSIGYLPLIIAALIGSNAHANSHSFDSRSHAMGGVGVSSADYLTAPFHNPALVARFDESDDVGILFPSIGAHANDPTDIIDNVEYFSDIYDDFKYINNPSLDDAQVVIDQLELIQGNYAHVQVGTQVAVAIPNKVLSINFFAQAYADALVFADIADEDLDPANIVDQELNSQAITMGVIVSEFGVSLAKSHKLATGEIYYGISPKYQQVNTINYITDIENFEFDDWDDDRYQNDQGNMNLDIGFAYQHNAGYGVGFVAKNLIKNTYETEVISGIKGQYQIKPVYTISANYHNRFMTAVIDIQLNESEGYDELNGSYNQFDTEYDNQQLAAIGFEFTPWSWTKLRAGYQTDLTNNNDDRVTAGLGLSAAGVFHFDLSASYGDDKDMGVALQTSFTF
ncbi:conjugal transfer protein TraF [Shewanella olleyana]|uniref:conjugal transfer protein TraF n=1 Tax=Shewanella olleyana TaxID=135626 RepID=UPI00200EF756|nr:conjugal transfer protein TraF [Shewanella olleyana]MCL1067816.1 conjugal transfer protein TraF [Shewanella olleyana]